MLNIVYIVPLVLAFVGLAQVAHATDESSYEYGYKMAQVDYRDCLAADNGCGTVTTACFSSMTNNTACIDGYVHGWNHVCDPVKAKENDLNCPTTLQQEVRRVGY